MEQRLTPYGIIRRVIGEIEPLGETRSDEVRLKNLEETLSLMEALLYDIERIATYKDRPEHSIKTAGKAAHEFLTERGFTCLVER